MRRIDRFFLFFAVSIAVSAMLILLWVASYGRRVSVEIFDQTSGGYALSAYEGTIDLASESVNGRKNLSGGIKLRTSPLRFQPLPFWNPQTVHAMQFGQRRDWIDRFGGTVLKHTSGYAQLPCWAAAAALSLLDCMLLRQWLRRRRALRSDTSARCHACGYDLRATPVRCLECGREAPSRAAHISNAYASVTLQRCGANATSCPAR